MNRTMICALTALTLCAGAFAADWDLHSDTWTATDAVGRTLPGYKECGPPRQDRYVGLFYFLWLGEHSKSGPWNLSEIVAANPTDPKYGPEQHFHHWGESELGYYLSSDPYVIRKHCQMFADAGVDTLIMDVTNGFTYTKNYMKLCAIYTQIRREGGHTPQICFITHAGSGNVVRKLYDEFYSKNLYPDLWFRWQGKPLILATPDDLSPQMKEFFTVRYSWFAHDPKGWFGDGQDRWTWLDPYPQEAGWHVNGVPEEMSVGIATHPLAGLGRSNDGQKQPDAAHLQTDKGIYFAKEFERALQVDPQFIFITGWNEWVAQRFIDKSNGNTYFVDQYTQEFSRDAEPMKGGHTDNYYYQMASYIRRFKGVRPPETSAGPKTITMDGKFGDWADVQPEFRDHIGDTTRRYWKGWGSAGWYVNNTGRNDILRSRVSYDQKYAYFYAETRNKLTSFRDPGWMLLFIDADCNPSTGWHGYDYVLNRSVGVKTSTLMKNTGGWHWKQTADVAYNVSGNKLEIRVPRSDLGLAGKPVRFDFHWADNIKQNGDIIEFAVSGDSAPDRRFNYHFEQR